jgi:hypothetical protein
MLERTSRFILEVFPYLSAALIAAFIVPGYLYSQVHGLRAAATPTSPTGNEHPVEIIHRDHAAFALSQAGRTRVSMSANPAPAEAEVAYAK